VSSVLIAGMQHEARCSHDKSAGSAAWIACQAYARVFATSVVNAHIGDQIMTPCSCGALHTICHKHVRWMQPARVIEAAVLCVAAEQS
jgi:hypothetical protein